MTCVNPFVKAGEVYPCGQCLPCKFKARRIWFHRVLLEASQHDYSSVVTLTYDEASTPQTGEVYPSHLRDWLKRIRKRALERYSWRRLRFMGVGEYGEKSERPHYHVILFGQPSCERGRTGRQWCCDCECDTCVDLTQTWTLGVVSVDRLSPESSAYVAGYVTRKVLAKGFGTRRAPFTRMSNRPGIGAYAMHDVASTVLQYNLTLPYALVRHGRPLLLGRYLRKKLSEAVDQEVPRFEPTDAMRSARDYAFVNSRSVRGVYSEVFSVLASQLQQKEALQERGL